MKKIFFVAIAATLLAAGCQKTEVLNQVNPVDGTAMTFAPNTGKLTKASAEADGLANLKDQDFRLWAYYVAADPNRDAKANDVYDYMSNIIVADNEAGAWASTTTHFWPGKNKALKFFAISADNATYGDGEGLKVKESKVTVTPDENGGTMKVTGFTVNPEAPDTDLMVADYVEAAQKGSDINTTESNTVNFTFRHALTKVQFLFKNTENSMPVYLQQMYVEKVNTVADLTVTGTTAETTMTWDTPKTEAIFTGDYIAPEGTPELTYEQAENIREWNTAEVCKISASNYMKLGTDAQVFTTWLVIPQPVYAAGKTDPTTDLKVTIAYVIESGENYRQFVQTFSLGSESIVPSWDPNQYVRYTINLTPNIIGLDATVEEWVTDGGDVNIND